jgi:maleate cis-trans isomerase
MMLIEHHLNPKFASFFEEGGFEVAAMKGCTEMPFSDLGKIPVEEIYAQAKKIFVEAGGGDCPYLLGAGWDCLPAIEPLERDLRTVVVTNVTADFWAAPKRFRIRAPWRAMGDCWQRCHRQHSKTYRKVLSHDARTELPQ